MAKPTFELEDNDVTLKDGPHSLLSNGGAAIVVHAKADDYKTDPVGKFRRPRGLRRDHEVDAGSCDFE